MNEKRIHSSLTLAYPPISNFEFYHLKQEKVVQSILEASTLYIIAQREELTFDNIVYNDKTTTLHFEIKKKGSEQSLICSFDIYQEATEKDKKFVLATEFGNNEKAWTQKGFPLNGIKGIKFYRGTKSGQFLLLLTPDIFIDMVLRNQLTAVIHGEIEEFRTFKVRYVGESTDQEIWKRLTGHEKIQDILTLETPFHYESLPTHEITILLFKIAGTETVSIFDGSGDIDEFVDEVIDPKIPSIKQITLDVEKAIIKVLKPEKIYNKIQYKQYPKSEDGLFKEGFAGISYKIYDNLILEYNNVSIAGNPDFSLSSTIRVENNETLTLESPSGIL